MDGFVTPWWLPGGHAQTIWPAKLARRAPPSAASARLHWRRERWTTPDADFIDVDFLAAAQSTAQPAADAATAPKAANPPLLVLFHGLEGSSQSHYAQAFAHWAQQQRWRYVVPHFRGCSGALNLAPRAYHSGDFEEIGWILERLCRAHGGPVYAVGVSLGGNALLRWAEEAGASARHTARAVAAVCSPVDLAASGHAIGRGLNRQIYTRMFLRTMRPRALAKLAQHPGLFNRQAMLAARDLYDFDNLFTAPLHGFKNTEDYWRRASAKPQLAAIRIPALLLNARNDPFVPATSLPQARAVGPHVTLWQPAQGGHVGFAGGRFPGHLHSLPDSVMRWMQQAG